MQLPFTEAVLLSGSIVKIVQARRTRQRKIELGDPPNQELNKIIRLKERSIQILLCLSQRRLKDLYLCSVSVQNLTVYELDGKTQETSIYRTIHCFNLYTLFLTCQVTINVLVLLINIVFYQQLPYLYERHSATLE